jgi:hypothetical protein
MADTATTATSGTRRRGANLAPAGLAVEDDGSLSGVMIERS